MRQEAWAQRSSSWRGCRGIAVIGTASLRKHDYLRELGAIPTTYGDGLEYRVRGLSPSGIDAAIDVAGSGIIPELIRIVGDPIHVLSVADFSAEKYGAKFSHGPPVAIPSDCSLLWPSCVRRARSHCASIRPLRSIKQREAQEASQSGRRNRQARRPCRLR